MSDFDEVFNEWQNNINFREAFKKNPEAALKEAGFDISPADLEKIRSLLKVKKDSSDNDELDDRISK